MFAVSAEKHPDNPLLWEKSNGTYQSISYADAYKQCMSLASGLINMGLQKNDKVILYAEGRAWWLLSELAIIACGAVSVPVSVRIEEPDDLLFRIRHSESKYMVVSPRLLSLTREIIANSKLNIQVIIIDLPNIDDIIPQNNEFLLSNLLESNKQNENLKEKLNETIASISPDDVVNICYTSGTTADPKGIMLTHLNYITNVRQATAMVNVTPDFITLLMLPWDHSFAHTVGLYSLLFKGASVAAVDGGRSAVEALRNVPGNIREIKPYFLLSVPALAKNFRANITKGIRDKGAFTYQLFSFFLKASMFYNGIGANKGKGLRILVKPIAALGNAIIFKKIRAGFGGRLQFFIGGGALLDIDIQKFFNAIGIPMYQGYGLSEAAPVISTNTEKHFLMGSSGRIVPELEVVITDEEGNPLPVGQSGEIRVRGGNVMKGYWKNEQATQETIQNGFLLTGDLGYLNENGFLFVKGRFKSLLIANDGEKYSPEALEEAMVYHASYIDQVYLHNNQNPFTTALVVVNSAKLSTEIRKHNNNPGDQNSIKKALDLITHDINKLRFDIQLSRQYPARWLPGMFALLEEPFSEKNQLMNSTMKIVRPKIEARYHELFSMMYDSDAKAQTHVHNTNVLEKILQS